MTPRRRAWLRCAVATSVAAGASACSLLVDSGGLVGSDGNRSAADAAQPDAPGRTDGGSSDALDATPCTPTGVPQSVTRSPASVVDDPRVGTVAWQSPDGARTTDSATARAPAMIGTVVTHWLRAGVFGFDLPARARVRGITVAVNRYAGSSDEIADHAVALVRGAVPEPAPKSDPQRWPTSPATATYGGPADTWDARWTVDDVMSPGFGAVIAARGAPAFDETAFVDSITVTVHFDPCAP